METTFPNLKGMVQDPVFTRPEAAEYLRVKAQTLAVWACKGSGPPFSKVGRLARYRKSALDSWLAENVVATEG